ncbi:hypothetical protein [Mycobacterium kubicae]|uniref:hypothetical protein n=1 Tax=Mycobacterium kubicae TaxID=120959 RepID=UPI0007FBF73C|nr:hypothetical protein [Mycobacterium kubicae]OBK53541.1 hypothetical protein A5657_01165 [Mycobacterium kubicae]
MNDVLTDHGDPEKRIADLDHQRADRNRAAGLLPSGPQDAAPSRRFLISAAPPSSRQMMKYTNLMMLGAMASLGVIYLLLFWVGALLDAESVMQVGGFVVFIAFLLLAMPAFGLFQRRMNRKKTVVVDIVSGGVTISASPGDNFPFGEAQLGKWTIAGYGETAKGTALHLRSGPHRFVIGGQDHRVATGTPLDAPPVDSVDATMWAPEFDDLLTAIGRRSALDARGPAAGEPTRCLLVPNVARTFSSSVFGSFKNTATALRLNTNPPQPTVAIDVGDDAISVVDLASNARIASASPPHVIASPAASTRSAPYAGAMTMALLIVRVANSHPLTIGCPDFAGPPQAGWSGKAKLTYRFAWRGQVPSADQPAFIVSDADWLTLVEKFGLVAQLEDRARADGNVAATPGGAPLARPKRKLWIYGVIVAAVIFVVVPAMMISVSGVWDSQQRKDQQLKADRERPFALPFTDLRVPHGVAVDAAGNVYVTDGRTNRVLKLMAGSNTQTVLPFTGLDLSAGVVDNSTGGIAVDGDGNVYVTDSGHNRVLELAVGSSSQTVLPFRGLDFPEGLAVDAAGTVYVADRNDYRVVKLVAGSKTQTELPSLGRWVNPNDLAVDAMGTVYASVNTSCRKSNCSYLVRLAPGADGWTTLPSAGTQQYVAVGPAGDLYVITSGDKGGVMRLAPGSDTWTELPGGFRFVDPQGLAVDTRGNLYVTDHTGSRQPETLFDKWELASDDSEGFVLKLPAR